MIPLVGHIQARNDLQPLAAPSSQGQTSPTGQAGYWDLIFSDEFTGTSLNQDKWTTCYWWDDDGCSNEGNNELQWYMPDDVLVQDGMLRLRARERTVDASNGETYDYTSGMVTTGPPNYKDLPPRFSYMYGFTEIRAKVPVGKGLWPAFWMLPTDYTSKPEIDVLEVLGDQINVAHLTYHYLDQYGFNMRANYDWIGPDFSADWHVFGVDWTPEAIIWYIDGIERFRFDEEEYIPAVEMYLLLNLAVGGDWPGAPDDETVFPNFYDIDYVRVWKPGVPPTATPTPTVTPTHTSTSTPTITSTATPEPTITATIEPTASMPDIGETSVMGNLTSGLVDPTFVWVPDVEVNQWYQIAIVNADGEIILSDWINVSDTCATGWCNFTPGSNLPTGLANGNYTWWIQGWNAENGYGEWSQGESFTVDVPLPLPIHFDINPNQGRPEFTWNHEPNALWYQMYMQNTEGEARFQKWVEARKICTDDVCHFEPDVNPVGGTYQVWIQAWGAAGSNEWVGPVEFSLPQTPPDPPTGLTVSYSGDAVTLTWLGVDNVTWYEIWIGTNQNDVYEPIHHQPWTLASEFDCEQPGTCTFTLETELVNNIYEWWIRAWGPGGFNSGGTSGWLRLGRFEVP